MIPSILNCSYHNDVIVAEIHQHYIDSHLIILGLLESFLISYFHTTALLNLDIMIKLLYFVILVCNLICFISIILFRLDRQDSETTKERIIIFLTVSILNPPWINIDIFIDKTQSICKIISNWHLFFKLVQISTITFSLAFNLDFDYYNISFLISLSLGIALTFNYIRQIFKHISRKDQTNFDRQDLKKYYQLSFRNRQIDFVENQLYYTWIQETKLLSNNINQQQLIGSHVEQLFHTFFKPCSLPQNENMFKNNQTLFLCIDNKMKLQYFSADRLLAFALFCIYNFMRFSKEASLKSLPNINKPDEVNEYFEKFQVLQRNIFINKNIKEITFPNQADFSKSIFIYKFFERMLELPLVKIIILFDHQKHLQNHSNNRYRDFLQQLVSQIVIQRFQSLFDFNYKLLLYDFYEDDFLPTKINHSTQSNQSFTNFKIN